MVKIVVDREPAAVRDQRNVLGKFLEVVLTTRWVVGHPLDCVHLQVQIKMWLPQAPFNIF